MLVPWAVLTVVTAITWRTIFEPDLGFVNTVLSALHLPGGDTVWLGEQPQALFVMIFADVWKTAPFMALLILAGLQVIPDDVYEAAKVDGATAWQRFTKITLPLLDAGDPRRADLPHAGRAADLRPAVRADQGRQRHEHAVAAGLPGASGRTDLIGLGLGRGDPDVHHRDDRLVLYIRFVGGNIEALADEELAMSTAAATASRQRRPSAGPDEAAQEAAQGAPLMWIAVAAIIVFCLFPFYWLVNISLKTGADLSSVEPVPAAPDARQLQVDLQERRLHQRRCATRAIVALTTTVLALDRRVVLRLRARAAEAARQVRRCSRSSCRSRRSRRSRSRPRCSSCGPTSGSTTRRIGLDHPVPDVRAAAGDLHPRRRSSGRSRRTSRRRRSSTGRRTSRPSARSSCRWRRRAWRPPAS